MNKTADPWAPYRPTAADPWNLAKVAHLHRRAGLGASWPELQRDLKAGFTASIDRLLAPPSLATDEQQILQSLQQGAWQTGYLDRLQAYWLNRLLWHPDSLREKLTLFWHSHFATSNRKVQSVSQMLGQNEMLRQHALGNFREVLAAIITDPAMLIWLDGAGSSKKKPNENFAREFLELFTLGIGHYTEKDIREAARAFTGWVRGAPQSSTESSPFRFEPAEFDAGTKTVLGKTGPWKPADIVRIALEQPACAEFLCRKLYRYFISEANEPHPDFIGPLAREFSGSGYSIRHIVGILLRSRHFFDAKVRRQRIKGPVEFSAGLLRQLGLSRQHVRLLALAAVCGQQGQELFEPPNVKGWEGGKRWINSLTLLERGNWLNAVVWGQADLGMPPFDPLTWTQSHHIELGKLVSVWIDLLLQGELTAEARALIVRTAQDGRPDSLGKALQLILHCPSYQLA